MSNLFSQTMAAITRGFVLGVLLGGAIPGQAVAEGLPKALILSSEENPAGRTTTPILRRILIDSGRFDVRVNEAPAGLSAKSLEGFDLVIDNGVGGGAESGIDTAISGFVKSGKGLVVTRGALGSSASPELRPLRGGPDSSASVQFLDVTLIRPDHPITAGLKSQYRTADVLSTSLAIRGGAETIAVAAVAGASDEQATPVLAVSQNGGGRIVGLAIGHDASALYEPQTIALFARACEFAATGAVTLPPEFGSTTRPSGSVRGLVITGGHDHEAAFYSLFNGYDDLQWFPVETSATAFKKDLRDSYDVIIMYDFTRELDDAGKKNLQAFVESGKGIVVLHHALLNFQSWNWWSENVAGGRYRLQREGDHPSSGVKNDQQIDVTPAMEHPVLAGIGPFHIQDEAYKNLFMSEKIKPLLTTDNPTSDHNLAWIGPCETARVVAIQLGHGHTAFGHPSYRKLVHNAILWTAGKTK